MFDKFTVDATQLIKKIRELAIQRGGQKIEPEDFFNALINEGSYLGFQKSIGLPLENINMNLNNSKDDQLGALPFSKDSKRVLEDTLMLLRRHDLRQISVNLLALAIITSPNIIKHLESYPIDKLTNLILNSLSSERKDQEITYWSKALKNKTSGYRVLAPMIISLLVLTNIDKFSQFGYTGVIKFIILSVSGYALLSLFKIENERNQSYATLAKYLEDQ